jgi:hypothetical protein
MVRELVTIRVAPTGLGPLKGWHTQHSIRWGGLHTGLLSMTPSGSLVLRVESAEVFCIR